MPRTEPIPQPKGDPVIGNLRAIDGDAPMQGFMRLARIHGPIFQLEFFGRPLILVSSQEIVDELCDESRFDKRDPEEHPRLRRGRARHREDRRAELGEGASPADAGVRADRHPRHVRPDARHRRPDADALGALRAERGDRGDGRHDAAHARHDRAVRLRLPLQQLLPARDASVRRRDGRCVVRDGGARTPPRHRQQADAAQAPRLRGRPEADARGRRRPDRRAQARPQRRRQEGPARPDAAGPRPGHRRGPVGREHPLPARHVPDRRPRDDQRTALVRHLLPLQEPAGSGEGASSTSPSCATSSRS